MNLKAINLAPTSVRLAVGSVTGIVLLFSVFAFIWGFASAASSNAEFKEVADLLTGLSPSDPQTHFASASLHEKALDPGDLETALREYEIATALAPHNYLLWLRLAAVRGRAGDTAGVDVALRQAQRLAPNYARVQWALGNFLLREGRDDEAYSELRKAVAGDPSLAPMAAATSLQMVDGDASAVGARFENSPKINVALSSMLAAQKRFEEALELWNRIPPQDDNRYRDAGKQIREALITERKFAAAVSMKGRDMSDTDPVFEKITNAGFEQPVKTQGADAFEWRVTQGTYPQVGVTETHKLSGSYSLIVLLSGQGPKEFRGPSQLVAVRSGRSYEFNVPYRSDVKSAAAFQWEIVVANDGRRLGITPPLVSTLEWMKAGAVFTVPADSDGIEVRFVRSECIGTACAASGSFWFDDLALTAK